MTFNLQVLYVLPLSQYRDMEEALLALDVAGMLELAKATDRLENFATVCIFFFWQFGFLTWSVADYYSHFPRQGLCRQVAR